MCWRFLLSPFHLWWCPLLLLVSMSHISMMLNKIIIQCYWVNVITSSLPFYNFLLFRNTFTTVWHHGLVGLVVNNLIYIYIFILKQPKKLWKLFFINFYKVLNKHIVVDQHFGVEYFTFYLTALPTFTLFMSPVSLVLRTIVTWVDLKDRIGIRPPVYCMRYIVWIHIMNSQLISGMALWAWMWNHVARCWEWNK